MLPEMKLAADRDQFDFLLRATGYKASCTVHRDAIEAGLALYNDAIGRTKEDKDEDAALLAERKKAEAAVGGETKDYAAMLAVVEAWDTLLPAIHAFHEAKRQARQRPPGPDPTAERELDAMLDAIVVAPGSGRDAFDDATVQVRTLRATYRSGEAEEASPQGR